MNPLVKSQNIRTNKSALSKALFVTFSSLLISACLLGEEDDAETTQLNVTEEVIEENDADSTQLNETEDVFEENDADSTQLNGTEKVFMFTSDYNSGELHSLNLETKDVSAGISFHQDSKLRTDGEHLWVLERLGADNLVKLPLDFSSAKDIVFQKSLPDNSNPVDIKFYNQNIAYVSLQNANKLLQINPKDGSTKKVIDVSDYAYDKTQFANTAQMTLSNDSLFVLVQGMNGYSTGNKGIVLLIDAKTGTITKEYELPLKNPTSIIKQGQKLIISMEGEYLGDISAADKSRGILSLDITTGISETLFTDIDLEGTPHNLKSVDNKLFVQVKQGYDDSWNSIIKLVELDTDAQTSQLVSVKAQGGGIAWSNLSSQWIVGQRVGGSEAILLVDDKKKIVDEDMLPPYDILIVGE